MYLPGRSQLESGFGEGWGNIGENTPSLQTSVSLLENGGHGADLTWLLQEGPNMQRPNCAGHSSVGLLALVQSLCFLFLLLQKQQHKVTHL